MTPAAKRPTIRLTCPACDGEMIRAVADGLKFGDRGLVTVQKGYEQVCQHCGAVHGPGAILQMYFAEKIR